MTTHHRDVVESQRRSTGTGDNRTPDWRRIGLSRRDSIERTLLFTQRYHPGVEFRVVDRLPTSTTVDILDGPDDEGVPVISQADAYDGFIVDYCFGRAPAYTFLFTTRSLSEGRKYALGTDATYFSPTLGLVETTVEPAGSDGD